MLPIYAAIASILPVWVLMCPRDYLSSYMKVGVVIMLAAGIFLAQPDLKMPATTHVRLRRRAGRDRIGLAVRVHRDHVRRAVGLSRADRLGHDAEDDQQGIGHPADRLRGDDSRRLRGLDRADCRVRLGAGRLFQNQHRPRYAAGSRRNIRA